MTDIHITRGKLDTKTAWRDMGRPHHPQAKDRGLEEILSSQLPKQLILMTHQFGLLASRTVSETINYLLFNPSHPWWQP